MAWLYCCCEDFFPSRKSKIDVAGQSQTDKNRIQAIERSSRPPVNPDRIGVLKINRKVLLNSCVVVFVALAIGIYWWLRQDLRHHDLCHHADVLREQTKSLQDWEKKLTPDPYFHLWVKSIWLDAALSAHTKQEIEVVDCQGDSSLNSLQDSFLFTDLRDSELSWELETQIAAAKEQEQKKTILAQRSESLREVALDIGKLCALVDQQNRLSEVQAHLTKRCETMGSNRKKESCALELEHLNQILQRESQPLADNLAKAKKKWQVFAGLIEETLADCHDLLKWGLQK